ncbi:cell wall-binding protein [uncultured Clostridium sp.]|uniref:cell wall-binding protein n=1 Tax=uncultured Clostridium sp. TaxID=59620 RepID=UPI0025DCE931|nr:cell wall-binding protein [uncultured Clostridium sp.]
MKKFKKLVAGFIAMLSLMVVNPIAANAEWRQDSTGWWYTEGNSWATRWKMIDGNWYYFYSDGYMAHDCWIGNYYLNSQGAWTLNVPTQTQTTAVTNQNNKSQTCYLSATGSKYHRINNCGRMNPNNATQTTVENAEAQGYGRCSKCW